MTAILTPQWHVITLAPKKLIRTRRASEGSASEPSLARRVSMCKDAKLSCRGNMEAGADDCLGKPFDAQELKVRLRAGKRIVDLEEALRVQATHDALTGAWNHG